MNAPFRVSVIIPVFNAEKFVRKAVESAVRLEEVAEIILVDDGYPDGALRICEGLATKYPSKVKLFRHPNGENRGPGASRNLGIQKSTSNYIAFLDADDWYLPNRFLKDKELFTSDDTIEGVYGCTQTFIDDNGQLTATDKYSTVDGRLHPVDLSLRWLTGEAGAFTTDAITVRRDLFKKTGYFDPTLRLHQDSHLYYRFLWHGNIVPGETKVPIAVRRKHPHNRIAKKNIASKHQYYRKLFESYEEIADTNVFVYRKLFHRYVSTYATNQAMVYLYRIILIMRKPRRLFKLI